MTSSLSEALKSAIDNIAFYDFPSGTGSWNSSANYKENASLINEDELLELLNKNTSPWNKATEYSDEILRIKRDIIFCKICPSIKTIKKMLKSIKLIDKNIGAVDRAIDLCESLRELVLSANHVDSVDARMLPHTLQILELYSNQLRSLDFCSSRYMPNLEHLGVGANLISDINNLANSNLKHSLISLDLGKNKLSNLSNIVEIIKQFSNLKILILAGNPLSLFAAYRAYVIDSLKTLISLDDLVITADERFSVDGMENISESMKTLCKFTITVNSLNNIPPKEIPENEPEEPIIKTEYFIKFWFPFRCPTIISDEMKPEVQNEEPKKEIKDEIIYLHTSLKLPRMNEDIILNWSEDLLIDDVTCLCDFFNEKLRIEVMEESKYLYSPDNLPQNVSRNESPNNQKRQQKSGNKRAPENIPKPNTSGKKKKIDESKMVVHSKTSRKLAEYFVDLSNFKNGETNFDNILKSDAIEQKLDNKSNDQLEKQHSKDLKQKRPSAKDDIRKPAAKGNLRKEKTIATSSEPWKAIECHLALKLLTISNIKSADILENTN